METLFLHTSDVWLIEYSAIFDDLESPARSFTRCNLFQISFFVHLHSISQNVNRTERRAVSPRLLICFYNCLYTLVQVVTLSAQRWTNLTSGLAARPVVQCSAILYEQATEPPVAAASWYPSPDTRHHALQPAAVCRFPQISDSWHMHPCRGQRHRHSWTHLWS